MSANGNGTEHENLLAGASAASDILGMVVDRVRGGGVESAAEEAAEAISRAIVNQTVRFLEAFDEETVADVENVDAIGDAFDVEVVASTQWVDYQGRRLAVIVTRDDWNLDEMSGSLMVEVPIDDELHWGEVAEWELDSVFTEIEPGEHYPGDVYQSNSEFTAVIAPVIEHVFVNQP